MRHQRSAACSIGLDRPALGQTDPGDLKLSEDDERYARTHARTYGQAGEKEKSRLGVQASGEGAK